MSEETAKLLIEAINRLADAMAKSGSQTVYHYHYPQSPTYHPPYYPQPGPYWTNGNTVVTEAGRLT